MIKNIVREAGSAFFPVALLARLPFAMIVVGVLTLVVTVRDSVLLGGVNSALVGIGTATIGPFIGAAADRFGQRKTLLAVAPVHALTLVVFVLIVYSELPNWVMLISAFTIGASATQTSPMSRTRLIEVAIRSATPDKRDKALSLVMAYESTADEIVFVFGPVVVGVLAIAFGAGSPVLGAALLTLVFVSWFALLRGAKPTQTVAERNAILDPVAHLFKPELLVIIVGIFGMGLFFGSMLTSLTAFMQSIAQAEKTGILYGAMGLGSAVLAISIAFFPPAFSKRYRLLFFSLVMLTGALILLGAKTQSTVLFALIILGLGVGPMLVTFFSFGADRSPAGRGATVMTILGSAITVGQSLSSAATGWYSESIGVTESFRMPLISVLIILAASLLNWILTDSGRQTSSRTSQIPIQ